MFKSKKSPTIESSNEVICIWRRTASQAASGAYPTDPVVDGALPVGAVILATTVVGGIGLTGLNFACRKATSEQ